MSKGKRVTLVEKNKKQEAKVYTNVINKRGKKHLRFIVRGWKKDGKWQKKQFASEADANAYAASININLENQGEERKLVLTSLNDKQVRAAENVFRELGNSYTIEEVAEFFLKHNRAPDFSIDILDGLEIYLNEKAHEGVRPVTLKKTNGVLRAFAKYAGDPLVHTVTKESIDAYLKTLRANDGTSPAKRKTWNNHRNEIASFFKWAGVRDLTTNRPWTLQNPAEDVLRYSNDRVAEQRPEVRVSSPEVTRDLLTYAMNYKGGKMAKLFALIYFAGIRPDLETGELHKLNANPSLIKLRAGRIAVPPDVAKTKSERPVSIMDNLKPWLEAYKDFPLIPVNGKNDYAHIRKQFDLQQDETRHSFISHHVAVYRSIADAALQAGNSETMIRKHYLTFPTKEEGEAFFSIVPDMAKGEAVIIKQKFDKPNALRAI